MQRDNDSNSIQAIGSDCRTISNNPCLISFPISFQEIYLQKNGTNQLGITLGYDTKSASGNLMVCEVRHACPSLINIPPHYCVYAATTMVCQLH